MADKRKNYDLKFKMSAIKCAEETTNRQAATKFAVDESMIRRWRKNSLKIYDESSSIIDSKRKRLTGAGRKPVLGDLEEELLEKIIDEREKHYHVSCKIITVWAIPNFKEILSLHILQEMKHSEGVTPIGGLVYMCQHVLWIILRHFSSSIKNKVKITKKQGYRKRKVS